ELVGDGAEPQIETGGLELRLGGRHRRGNPALLDRRAQRPVRKDAGRASRHEMGRLTAPGGAAGSARGAPLTPAPESVCSIARATPAAVASSATRASSDGPAPLSTQPSAPASRAAAVTSAIQGNSVDR